MSDTVNFEFYNFETVKIKAIEQKGFVVARMNNSYGVNEYKVAYWMDGKKEEVWHYEFELASTMQKPVESGLDGQSANFLVGQIIETDKHGAPLKPPTQGVVIEEGINQSGVNGPASGDLRALGVCSHPYFQDYALCMTDVDPNSVLDLHKLAVEYLLAACKVKDPADFVTTETAKNALIRELQIYQQWAKVKYGQEPANA
jgi:hypothetical protein